MNILEITMFYYPAGGGASTTIESMVKALCKRGHQVHLVYPIFDVSLTSLKNEKSSQIPNLKLHPIYVKSKFTFKYFKIYDFFTRKLLFQEMFKECNDIIKSEHIDYIISHFHESTEIGIIGQNLSDVYNIPHIVKVHDIYPFISLTPEIIYSILNYSNNKKVMRLSNLIQFPNKSMREKAVKRYNFNIKKSAILPNGLFMDDFNESRINLNRKIEQEVNFVFVGGLYRNRRLYNILYSISEINKEYNFNLNLYIVGDGVEKPNLIKFISGNKLTRFVKILGNLSHNEVLEILNKSHIGIGPMEKNSISEFQMPIKIIEYMAMGLPWIAYGHDGIIELNDSKCGIIIRSSSINVIKSEILSLINDRPKYELMSKCCREYAIEHFDWNKNIERFLDSIEKKI
ncbi:MAG: hypothetical protein C3F06_05880 [Candidatus Methanoperedenaceae archaeon]|nr:MAG: hypothetical protein C3F06_05880 [Candidatus Methanoperedenaceae archaeon]